MYDHRAVSSQLQLRAANEPWRQAFSRNFLLLRADNVMAQGVRFVFSGVVVSIVYITITTVLSAVSHLEFQLALAIGWCAAVSVHFTLQRTFVWAREEQFALAFGHQVGRYLLVAGSQLGITAATTAVLPSVLGVSAEVVYLGTAALLTLFNFLVFRHGVFHA
jgi:putative flippase GtrA